jgi:hypothetical protein
MPSGAREPAQHLTFGDRVGNPGIHSRRIPKANQCSSGRQSHLFEVICRDTINRQSTVQSQYTVALSYIADHPSGENACKGLDAIVFVQFSVHGISNIPWMGRLIIVRRTQKGDQVAGIVVKVGTATVDMTGIEFMTYANHYLKAAEALARHSDPGRWFDPLPYQLLCQALELHLKSYIWFTDKLSRNNIRNKYGHDIVKLWRHSKTRGIGKFCTPTNMRDTTIALVGPYYKARKFTYLDLSMSWEGIPRLRTNPKSVPTLMRLCRQLRKSLRKPIQNAS